jgi:HEPN domain-containing protein
MPPKRGSPSDPHEWLNRARSNLVRARIEVAGAYLEDLCFDAQQAAEKALKALLIHFGVPVPYVHDLQVLLTRLRRSGHHVPKYIREAAKLTRFAVETRYPGTGAPVTKREYRKALRVAEMVERWVTRQIAKP